MVPYTYVIDLTGFGVFVVAIAKKSVEGTRDLFKDVYS